MKFIPFSAHPYIFQLIYGILQADFQPVPRQTALNFLRINTQNKPVQKAENRLFVDLSQFFFIETKNYY